MAMLYWSLLLLMMAKLWLTPNYPNSQKGLGFCFEKDRPLPE